jgi:hypothetical protein
LSFDRNIVELHVYNYLAVVESFSYSELFV